MNFETWTLQLGGLTAEYNNAKEATLMALRDAGYITAEQSNEIAGRLAIVAAPKGMLGRVWDLLHGNTSETIMQIRAVWTAKPKPAADAKPEKEG